MFKRWMQRLLGWSEKSELEKQRATYRLSSLTAHALSLLPIPLWWLLQTYSSDKHLAGWHSYGHTYAELFRSKRYRRLKLLEIGIGGYGDQLGGRSLLAWQAYFPLATIVACDIVPKNELGGLRRRIFEVDQSSAADLEALAQREGPFDIIIDDGSHLSAHQIFTFERMFEVLKDDGIYVIEDVQTSFWPDLVSGVAWDGARIAEAAFRNTCVGYFLELAKYLNHAEFVDQAGINPPLLTLGSKIRRISFEHNLILVFKGDNSQESRFVSGRSNQAALADTREPQDARCAQAALEIEATQ